MKLWVTNPIDTPLLAGSASWNQMTSAALPDDGAAMIHADLRMVMRAASTALGIPGKGSRAAGRSLERTELKRR